MTVNVVEPLTKEKKPFVAEEMIRVMSFNIRWDDRSECENAWGCRKEFVSSIIRFHRVDILGLQEPIYEQILDLQQDLPDYRWYGLGLEDGQFKGHFDPILYKKDRFEALDQGHFFLSKTPTIPSKGWDAMFKRGVTWVKLKDMVTNHIFYFFNTHFDYHGSKAREKSAFLLRQKMAEISENYPFVLAGDFNLFPELGGEKVHTLLTMNQNLFREMADAQFVSETPHHGPTGSWSGFKEAGQPGIKPDCILVDSNTRVLSHGILTDIFDHNRFPSDHLPVVSDLVLC